MSRLLIASLDRFGPLSPATRERLAACPQTNETYGPRAKLVAVGQRARLRLLTRGLAIKQAVLADGGRQIFGIATPGDLIDLNGLFVGTDQEIVGLGPCEVRMITAAELRALLEHHPDLLGALCRAVLSEARAQRSWMINLGRRSALARGAHLLCEIYWRQSALALARDGRCAFPAVQNDIADALGLSRVHTHRILRSLRETGLISVRHGVLHIHDWASLAALGAFDPSACRAQRDDGADAKRVHQTSSQRPWQDSARGL